MNFNYMKLTASTKIDLPKYNSSSTYKKTLFLKKAMGKYISCSCIDNNREKYANVYYNYKALVAGYIPFYLRSGIYACANTM